MDARPTENVFSVRGKGKSDKKSSYNTKIHDIKSTYSILLTLSLDEGVIHCNIVEGIFDMGTFYKFTECTLDHMQPFPAPNFGLVMDNCCIHKHPTIHNPIETQ